MSKNQKTSQQKIPVREIFIPPKNPDERHKWISTWIKSCFTIYHEVINKTAKAKPENDYKGFRVEAKAALKEILEACEIKRQAVHLLKETAHPQSEEDPKFTLIHTPKEGVQIAPLMEGKAIKGARKAISKIDDKGDIPDKKSAVFSQVAEKEKS